MTDARSNPPDGLPTYRLLTGAVRAQDFQIAEFGHGVAQLTYWSAHEGPSHGLHRRTLRSSLWVETECGWQLRFHQGTPIDAA